MKRIGITGGIGCGKSTIARIFECLGYGVYDTDTRAKALTDLNPEIRTTLSARFGDDLYSDRGINRERFASYIFNDASALAFANRVIHPVVIADFEAWCVDQSSNPYRFTPQDGLPDRRSFLFCESAILFEAGLDHLFDRILVVITDTDERIERVLERNPNLSREAILARMASQNSHTTPSPKNIVIRNNDTDAVLPTLLRLLEEGF